jgi:hypothetical protein
VGRFPYAIVYVASAVRSTGLAVEADGAARTQSPMPPAALSSVEPGRFTVLIETSSIDIQRGDFWRRGAGGSSVPTEAPFGPEIVP